MASLFRFLLVYLVTRQGKLILCLATALAIASAVVTMRIQVKTNFKDTLDDKDRPVGNATHIKQNFPAASTIYVTVEGLDRARMAAAALEVRDRLLADKEHVRAVYLKLNTEFFKDYGLVYLRREDLARILRSVRDFRHSLESMVGEPGLPTLLKEMEGALDSWYAGGDTSFILTQRITGGLVFEQTPFTGVPGLGGLQIQTKIDRDQLRQEYEKTLVPLLKKMPLPPSEAQFLLWIEPVTRSCELGARIVHEGTELSGELPRLLRELEQAQYSNLGKLPSEYRFSEDGTMLLMEVAGVGDIHELKAGELFIESIWRVLDDVEQEYPDVQLGATGFPVVYVEENHAVINNFGVVLALSAVGVLFVFILGFGQAGLPVVSFIPLVYGLLYTFAIQTLTVGELNMISLMFPVLLMGTGIDYGIHLIASFTEHRKSGLDGPRAIAKTFETIGAGIVTGAATTAAAFFSLMLADYKGVKHFGFISGIGILASLATMCLVLPPLILWIDRREVKGGHPIPSIDFQFLGKATRFCLHYRYFVLLAFLGGTVYFAGKLQNLELDRDVTNIEPRGLESTALQEKIIEKFALSTEVVAFVAEDLDEARQIQKALEARKTVGQVWSITSLIPEEKRQQENRPWILALRQELEAVGKSKGFDCSPAPAADEHPREHTWELETDPEVLKALLEARIRKRDEEEAKLRVEGREGPSRIEAMKESLARIKLAVLDLSVIARVLYSQESETRVGRLRDAVNAIDASIAAGNELSIEFLDYVLERMTQRIFCQLLDMASHDSLGPSDLPGDIVSRFQDKTGERYVVFAYPSRDPWERRFLERYVEELGSIRVRKPRQEEGVTAAPPDPVEGALSEEEIVEQDEKYSYRAPRFSGVIPIWMTILEKIVSTLPTTLLSTFTLIWILLLVSMTRRRVVCVLLAELFVLLVWSWMEFGGVVRLPEPLFQSLAGTRFEIFDHILRSVLALADKGHFHPVRISLWVFALATVTLAVLDRRALVGMVIILVPLGIGLVWSLGLWPVLGFKLNVVSITALPLILGLGIDDGVYIFHRIVQAGEARMEGAM
ncbi:MAG: MMPL family transporter, partial [Planctomycetes bacterium]|nr:MMPL family transporter [Planctomycetota bacterium]